MDAKANLNVSFDNLVDCEEVNNEIIGNLNTLIGNSAKNLSKVSQHLQDLLAQKKELEINLQYATNEAPDRIATALKKANDVLSNSEELQNEVNAIISEFGHIKKRSASILGNVSEQIAVIREADYAKVYLKWISHINEINNAMPALIENYRDGKALREYRELHSSAEVLSTSVCRNLNKYVDSCVSHWRRILLETIQEDFTNATKSLKWPFLKEDTICVKVSPEMRKRLDCDIEYLLYLDQIRVPTPLEVEEESTGVAGSFDAACLPIKLLLRPLEIRFAYHFSGDRATNSKENPQWYLTQILRWAALHRRFVETEIAPLVRHHRSDCDPQLQFVTGLIRLAAIKLEADLERILANRDQLFGATVQEALNFDLEIRAIDRVGEVSIVRVLTQPRVFERWRSLEEKFAHELLDEFVSATDAFSAADDDDGLSAATATVATNDDESGVCRCADQLIALLQGITNRCRQLPQPGHRLQFFELQLEILDNFRVRILQLSKSHQRTDPIARTSCTFLNTVHYLAATLREWDDVPLFVELHYFRRRFVTLETEMRSSFVECCDITDVSASTDEGDGALSKYLMDVTAQENTFKRRTIASFNRLESARSDETKVDQPCGSAFGEMIHLYEHIESEMLAVLVNYLLTEFRARSQAYRREKWYGRTFPTMSESCPVDISPSFCPMMEVLLKHVGCLKTSLTAAVFDKVWHRVSKSLDRYVYEEIILDTKFSAAGAIQLEYDVTRGFLPIFNDCCRRPENSFPRVKEALILLRVPTATALLLRDTLNLARDNREFPSFSVSPVKALEERGIFNFTIKDAENVLKLRTDLLSI